MILQESRVRNSHMIVGFSPFVTSVKELVILGEKIKENYPNVFIIVGGHFAAFHKDYLLKEYVWLDVWLDAVMLVKGELSLYEYCLSPTEKVAGVLKRNTGFKPRPRMRKRGRAKLERVLS
ncbi:hypothetical protein [Shimazuella alba]|uniref:B12-binding domain-containing protein n=1 Tax=Shimazuella alba TaxID=2690964 RepID=A0A6I4W0B3_9BACL|nr:hypothetical protein [Shimazuella alba]MXQ55670.1 hypothetical protein [Shimazuella alba]